MYPAGALAPSSYMGQARNWEFAGDANAALNLYRQIAILYPDSPFQRSAQQRSNMLQGGKPGAPAAPAAAKPANVPGVPYE